MDEEVEYSHNTRDVDRARTVLLAWRQKDLIDFTTSYDCLRQLLGLEKLVDLSEAQLGICRDLAGAHGWTIYKMLLARLDAAKT